MAGATRTAAVRTVVRSLLERDPLLRRRVRVGALLSVTTLLAGMALLGLSGWFITATAAAGVSVALARGFDVFTPSAGIRLLALGRTASRYGERLVTHDATLRALAALRGRLFRGWSGPGAARELLARPARLLFRLTADVDALDGLLLRMLLPAGLALLATVTAGAVLATAAPLAGLLLGVGLVAGQALLVAAVVRAGTRLARRRVAALEALRMGTIDLAAGQIDLRMTGRLDAASAACLQAEARLAKADDALHRLEVTAGLVQAAMMAVATVATMLVVADRVGAGALDLPRAVMVLFVLIASAEPLAALRRGAVDAGRVLIAAGRIAPRVTAAGPPAERSTSSGLSGQSAGAVDVGESADSPDEAVRCRSVGVAPGLLHDLTLRIAVGETVAVVGPSGAGKSTLLALLAGDLVPASGSVHALPATRFGQRTELFQDSLRDNLRLADPTASDGRLWTMLDAAGLVGDVMAMPEGLATRLGDAGLGLSSGQARRLALARLFLTATPVWLLDEPTEGLDARTARDVLARLGARVAGRTVVVATHLRREAAGAHRIVSLAGGRIVAIHARSEPGFAAALDALRSD